jgi:hypothetical protein
MSRRASDWACSFGSTCSPGEFPEGAGAFSRSALLVPQSFKSKNLFQNPVQRVPSSASPRTRIVFFLSSSYFKVVYFASRCTWQEAEKMRGTPDLKKSAAVFVLPITWPGLPR